MDNYPIGIVDSNNIVLLSFPGIRSPITKISNDRIFACICLPGTEYSNKFMYGIAYITKSPDYQLSWGLGNSRGYSFMYNGDTYYGVGLLSNGSFGGSDNPSDYSNILSLPVVSNANICNATNGSITTYGIQYMFENYPVEQYLSGVFKQTIPVRYSGLETSFDISVK